MKIHFFKLNFFRQFLFYSLLIFCGFGVYDGILKNIETEIIISIAAAALLVITLLYQYMSYIVIDEKGITYRSLLKYYYLRWDEIGQLKVIKRWNSNSIVPWIIVLRSKNPADIYKKRNAFNRRGECITVAFNRKIISLIEKYKPNSKNDEQDNTALTEDKTTKHSQMDGKGIETTVINRKSLVYTIVPILICFSFGIIGIVIEIGNQSFQDAIYFGAGFILLQLALVWLLDCTVYARYRFKINKNGVEFRHRKQRWLLKWEEVINIEILPNAKGVSGKWAFICFSKKEHAFSMADVKEFNKAFFGVQYRDKIIKEIKKYWQQPIRGLYQVKGRSII